MTARVGGGRVLALRRKLSVRDVAVLSSLARLRLMTGGQVQRVHVSEGSTATRPRRTRSLLKRLHDLKLIVRLSRTIGGIRSGSTGFVYGLSGLGQAVLDMQGPYEKRRRRTWETKPYFQDHVLAVAELYVRILEVTHKGGTEVLTFDAEPACWRRFMGTGGEPVILKPDAFVRVAVGDIERSAFVEVDLATESPNTVLRKCQVFATYWRSGVEQQRHGVFPRVLWLVPDERRRERLSDVVRHVSAEAQALFSVHCFWDGARLLTAPDGGAA